MNLELIAQKQQRFLITHLRCMIDEGGDEDIPNTVETWRDNAENLEGILCRILELLGD